MGVKATRFILFVALAILSTANLCVGQNTRDTHQNKSLDLHNLNRAYSGTPPMSINSTLAQVAQDCARKYAANKAIDHSCVTPNTGENLYMQWGSGPTPCGNVLAGNAFQCWWNEKVTYNFADPEKSTGVTGHFTQCTWKDSTQIGCGCATVGVHTVYCFKYWPQGNVMWEASGDKYQFYKTNVLRPQ